MSCRAGRRASSAQPGRGNGRDGALTERVFDVVTEEVGRLFRAHGANLARYESDPGSAMVVGSWESKPGTNVDEGHRVLLDGPTPLTLVRRTGRPARVDSFAGMEGTTAERIRELGIQSGAAARRRRRSTLGRRCRHERRSRGVRRERGGTAGQVRESRRRGDRKRGGARAAHRVSAPASSAPGTRSVYGSSATFTTARSSGCGAVLALRLVQSRLDDDPPGAHELLESASEELALALEELRELARGIHPAILTNRGLSAAIEALAARAPLRSSWGASARTGFRPPSKRPRTT